MNEPKLVQVLSSILGLHVEQVSRGSKRTGAVRGGFKATIGAILAVLGLGRAEASLELEASKEVADSYSGHMSPINKIAVLERYYTRLSRLAIVDLEDVAESVDLARKFGSVRGVFSMRDRRNNAFAGADYSRLMYPDQDDDPAQHPQPQPQPQPPFFLVSSDTYDLNVQVPVLPRFFDWDSGASQWFAVELMRLAAGEGEPTLSLAVAGLFSWNAQQRLLNVDPFAIQLAPGWLERAQPQLPALRKLRWTLIDSEDDPAD